MKRTLIVLALALCTLSCNKEFELMNPVDKNVELKPLQGLRVESMSEQFAVIRFNDPNFNAKYPESRLTYLVERSTGGGFVAIHPAFVFNDTSVMAIDSAMFIAHTSYLYRAQVVRVDEKSEYTPQVTTTYSFPAPANLQIISMTTTQVNLSWADNSSFETGFDIEQSTNSTTGFSVVKNVGANITNTIVTGSFDFATTYYFRIRAKSQYNVSIYSNVPNYNIAAVAAGLIFVEGGIFTMGSPNGVGSSNEQPQHSVTLSSFYIGRFEVTQKRWREVVQWKQGSATSPLNPNPSYFTGDSLPVEQVSWNDIQTWLGYLNEREGITDNSKKYRLPTEAEWEYAARGGKYWTDNYTYSGSNTVGNVAWYSSNSGNTTHTVGTKAPNQLGIYDMSGNVWEWCNDWYEAYSSSSQTNPTGPASGTYRVLRGGSWYGGDGGCRVAYRADFSPGGRYDSSGFRFVRTN